jgi:hypothetical protein
MTASGVYWSQFFATDPEVPGSIPSDTRFFWEVEGLERDPLSLVSTTEDLFGRNSSGSCLESREYGSGDPLRWLRETLLSAKVGINFADKR